MSLLVDQVVNLVREGVTGMDLLEVFLSRRIQPLQARDTLMWMYLGPGDTARVHPKKVTEEMVSQWLWSITGNKDNPGGPGEFSHSTPTTSRKRSGPKLRVFSSLELQLLLNLIDFC